MFDFHTWIIFCSAALALAFAPGPGMLYVLSQTMSGGRSAGIASTLGAASGGAIHVCGSALGISTILATSAVAFTLVKYLGALFLIYLGMKMLLSAFKNEASEVVLSKEKKQVGFKAAFYQGVVSEILNPKTAIFFLAFIPQFIQTSEGNLFGQFMLLGMVVVILNTIPDFLIAYFSKPIEKLWDTSVKFRKTQQTVSGACLIALGLYLAFSGSNKEMRSTGT